MRVRYYAIMNVKISKEGVALLFSASMPKSSSSSVVRVVQNTWVQLYRS